MTILPDDFFDDVDPDPDADGEFEFDCHMRPDGQRGKAGSEECDWECPVMRKIHAWERRERGSRKAEDNGTV